MKNQISNIKDTNQNLKIFKILICHLDLYFLLFNFDDRREERA